MMNRNLRESLAGGRNAPASSFNRRGQSLTGIPRDADENLDLFSKNRRSLPLPSPDESSDVPVKLGRFSLGSLKLPKGGTEDLLASTDGGKHDYDWLLTPPGTPLGSESRPTVAAQKTGFLGRSAVPTAKTSRLSISQSESSRPSRPTRSNSATRPSLSTSQYSTYSSNRSSSILNTSSASVSSYIRPLSPITRSPSTARPSSPSRQTLSRPSTPSRIRASSAGPSIDRTRPSPNSRPSTPSSRPQISSSLSTAASRPNSRPSTPARRSTVSSVPVASSSIVSAGRVLSTGRSTPAPSSRPSSPGPRVRATQQPIVPPDFPLETPPNLRTTLPDRPLSAGRSRPGASLTTKGSPEPMSSVNMPRRNPSPVATRGRLTEPPARGRVHANGHGYPADGLDSRNVSHLSHATRKTLKSSAASSESNGFGRTFSKNSLDMALRHMDIRNGKSSSNRPLATTTLFPQSVRSAVSRIQSVRALNRSESMNSNGSLQSGDVSENGSVVSRPLENSNEGNEGRHLAKLTNLDIYESTRYDTLLLKEDVKNTNWLHSIDDKSDQGLIFENGFEPPPEPFGPL